MSASAYRRTSARPRSAFDAKWWKNDPLEVADSAIEAAAAGAAIAHLHVREDDGTPSGRPELFVDVEGESRPLHDPTEVY